jgi:hypothetical protein
MPVQLSSGVGKKLVVFKLYLPVSYLHKRNNVNRLLTLRFNIYFNPIQPESQILFRETGEFFIKAKFTFKIL